MNRPGYGLPDKIKQRRADEEEEYREGNNLETHQIEFTFKRLRRETNPESSPALSENAQRHGTIENMLVSFSIEDNPGDERVAQQGFPCKLVRIDKAIFHVTVMGEHLPLVVGHKGIQGRKILVRHDLFD